MRVIIYCDMTAKMSFAAEVRQVKTMADMTVTVSLNLPEYHIAEAQRLLAMIGDMVTVVITGDVQDGSEDHGRSTGKRR